MLPSDASFTANSAERWLQPSGGSSRPEPSRYIATFSVVLMYALIVVLLVFENKFEPVTPPEPAAGRKARVRRAAARQRREGR
jgi:hypothetical protein